MIGCEFASIFQRFGTEVTIVEMLPRLIPMEDEDASKELAKQFGKRGIAVNLEQQCKRIEERDGSLVVHYGDDQTVEADLMLVSVGRGPNVRDLGLEEIGVDFDPRKGIAADEHRRTTVPAHLRVRATAPATGSSRTPRSARARSRPRTRPATTRSWTTAPCRGRSTPSRRSPASA